MGVPRARTKFEWFQRTALPRLRTMARQWALAPTSHLVRVSLLTAMLALGTSLVYGTGGTAYALAYLMILPILFAAAWYGLAGGLVVALLAGGLMATLPLEVATGTEQAPLNWSLRMVFYTVLGGVSGWLFQSLRRAFKEQHRLMRTDPRSNLAYWARTENSEQSLALIIVRVTDIADVLETMGADASDDLSKALARRLQNLVQNQGRVYRFSLAELAILMPGADQAQLLRRVEQIIELGEENLLIRGLPVRSQLALGSTLQEVGQRSRTEDFLKEARLALFTAIEQNLSHCRYGPELDRKTLETLRLIANVRRGLERGEFELHYQPKLALDSTHPVAYEALLRWRDPDKGLIGPGQFMPKLETTSLMGQVTRFVSREACQFAVRYGASVSINFSAHDLLDESMCAHIQSLVQEFQLEAGQLEIEVTESALIKNLDVARRAIESFRAMGLAVSIDDFGTGFASFEYLRHLPLTGIKIDRAFVRDLETDVRARKLMACMVDLGHALGFTVTAEGVETREQCRILQAMDCDLAQGFYFSRALPAPELRAWVEDYRPEPALLEPPADRDYYNCGLVSGIGSWQSA